MDTYNNTIKDDKTTKDGDYELFIRARSEQGHATATAGLALAMSSLYHHRSTQQQDDRVLGSGVNLRAGFHRGHHARRGGLSHATSNGGKVGG